MLNEEELRKLGFIKESHKFNGLPSNNVSWLISKVEELNVLALELQQDLNEIKEEFSTYQLMHRLEES